MEKTFLMILISFLHDFIKGYNKRKQVEFITRIATGLETGKNLTKSIEFARTVESNKHVKTKIERVLHIVSDKKRVQDNVLLGKLIIDELYNQRLITVSEYSMLKTTKNSIKDVFIKLAQRGEENQNFLSKIQVGLVIFITGVFGAMHIPLAAKTYLIEPNREMIYDLAVSKGLGDQLVYPFFIEHALYLSWGSFAFLIFASGIIIGYLYLWIYHTPLLYKINKFHAKFDANGVLYNLLSVHSNTGSNLTSVSNVLRETIFPIGLRGVFSKIASHMSSNKKEEGVTIASILKESGFTNNIYEAVNVGEDKDISNIWKGFEHASKEAQKDFNQLSKFILPALNKFLVGCGIFVGIMTLFVCMLYNYRLSAIVSSF